MFKKGKKLSPKTTTHNFKAKEDNDKILITGSFDANVWYSYDNDTKTTVTTKSISYEETEKLSLSEKEITNKDIIVRSLKQPTCISAKEKDNIIELEIEKELGVEIVGDTKVKVTLIEDEEETWDILDNEEKEELDNINTEYITEEIKK